MRSNDSERFSNCCLDDFIVDGWKKRYRDRVSGIDSFEVSGIDVGTGCWRQNVLMTTLRC